MASNQNNTDHNANTGGYIGEIEASLGWDANATSSASASGTIGGDLTVGDRSLASGRSTAGSFGLVKSLILTGILGVGFLIYLWADKGGK